MTTMFLNPDVSYFQNTFRPSFKIASAPEGKQHIHFPAKNGPVLEIFKRVKEGFWKTYVDAAWADKGGFDKGKKCLPCFTPSGTFRTRNDWDMLQYSQIVHLDYDNVDNPDLLKSRLANSPYLIAAFVSPGRKGVKAFFSVTSGQDLHGLAFTQVRKVFDDLTQVKSDSTARNLSRLCYVSFDPDAFINPMAEPFQVSDIVKKQTTVPDFSMLARIDGSVFSWLYNLTQQGKFQGEFFPEGYTKDMRNNFLFLFACNCNRYGIDQVTALEYCKNIWVSSNEGFPLSELSRSVQSAYSYRNEHASFKLPKHLH